MTDFLTFAAVPPSATAGIRSGGDRSGEESVFCSTALLHSGFISTVRVDTASHNS